MRRSPILAALPTKSRATLDLVIEHCYHEFLVQNYNPDEREYPDAANQIREVLIHENYMSQKDIQFCLGVDLSDLRGHDDFPNIEALHHELRVAYSELWSWPFERHRIRFGVKVMRSAY